MTIECRVKGLWRGKSHEQVRGSLLSSGSLHVTGGVALHLPTQH